jgi:hypothetical protein
MRRNSKSRKNFYLRVLAVALLTQVAIYAQDLAAARELYYKGVKGDRKASRESTQMFEALAAARPNDPVLVAYLASNKLLESGRTFALWNKNKLAREGIQGLDRAVTMAPDNLEVRFIRAASTFDLPSFFHRQEQSEAEFAWLIERMPAAAKEGRVEKRLADATAHYWNMIQKRKSGAR